MSAATRRAWLVAACGAAAIGAAFHLAAQEAGQGPSLEERLERAKAERLVGGAAGRLFATPDPVRPAPRSSARVAAAPTPKPVVPKFPFTYAGNVREADGSLAHYVHKGDDILPVREGIVLDGAWKIEALVEDRMEVAYLPAGERVSIQLSSLMRDPPPVQAAAAAPAQRSSPRHDVAVTPRTVSGPGLASRISQTPLSSASPSLVAGAAPAFLASQSAPAASPPPPQPSSGGPGTASAAVPTGRLGVGTPSSGSMPVGPAPTGKLGI